MRRGLLITTALVAPLCMLAVANAGPPPAIPFSYIGAPNGVAGLGAGGTVPPAQLPVNVPNGVAGLTSAGTVPTAQLPYVSVTARAPTAADDGSSGTPCATGMTWTYGGNTWQQQACGVSGAAQAHWQLMQNPGLPLDAVAALGNTSGHAWGTFKARSAYAGSDLVLSNLAGTPQTVTIGFAGNLGDYVSMDAFLSQYPESYTVIPDSFPGVYVPQEVTATTVYDQTDTTVNTAYNLGAPTGAFLATPTGGTGYTNSTVATLTTTGCTTVIDQPQISTTVSSGAPNPVALGTNNASQLSHPGECAPGAGLFQAAQTEASHTGGETTPASWMIGNYNQGPIWQFSPANGMGRFRGLALNGVRSQILNQQPYTKTLVNTALPWTPSSATVITVMRLADGNMQSVIYGSLADGQVINNNSLSVANATRVTFSNTAGSCNVAIASSPTVFAVTWNSSASNKVTCQDGNTFANGYTGGTAVSAATGFEIGGLTPANGFQGTWVMTLLWTTPLTPAQLSAAVLSIVMAGNLPLQYDKVLEIGGASNYTTGWITGGNAATSLYDNLTVPAKMYDVAVHGQVACGSGNAAQAIFAANNTYLYTQSVRKFVISETVGGNDITGGATAASVEPCIQSVVQQARALYPGSGVNNISVIWPMGVLQCQDLTASGSVLSNIFLLDSYILANQSQTAGGLGADAVINMVNDPILTGGTYTVASGQISATASALCSAPASGTPSYPNPYSADGAHSYRTLTDQWVPLWTGINAALAN